MGAGLIWRVQYGYLVRLCIVHIFGYLDLLFFSFNSPNMLQKLAYLMSKEWSPLMG